LQGPNGGTVSGQLWQIGGHRMHYARRAIRLVRSEHLRQTPEYPSRANELLSLFSGGGGALLRSRHTAGASAITLVKVAIRFATLPAGIVKSSNSSSASGLVTLSSKLRELRVTLTNRTTCVPQRYEPGQEGQVDWYEAWAELNGEPVLLQVFSMRSMASGAAFHRAYQRATQQAFLEAHEYAFDFFGGVFGLLRYDNLKSAVKKILRGYRREETARFIAFRSHWRFTSEFCSPYKAHEKGGIESGMCQRN